MIQVSPLVNGAVQYNRFGAVATRGAPPRVSAWYWEFAVQQGGMGAVDAVYGVVQRAVWAKTNLDLDRSTPGSTGVEAAGEALASLDAAALDAVAKVKSPCANFSTTLLSGEW